LAVLKVLRQKITATGETRGRNNQRIPKRNAVSIFNFPSSRDDVPIQSNRLPCQQVDDLLLNLRPGRWLFLCRDDIELLENLKANTAAVRLPKPFAPSPRSSLFFQI
jgi:hypothetical protein